MIRSISIAFLLTLLGKFVAFFRIQQMANAYPNSQWLDAFFISFSFCTLFETVIVSGALATLFIPRYISQKSDLDKKYFFRDVYLSFIFIFSVVSLFIFFLSAEVSTFLVDDNNLDLQAKTESLLKAFSILPLLSILFQLPTQGNQIEKRFAVSTLNPIIINTFQLLSIYYAVGLAVTDELAINIFIVVYLFSMAACYFIQRFFFNKKYCLFKRGSFRQVFNLVLALLPVIAFLSVEEINILVDQYFASSLDAGSVSNLMYGHRLVKIFGAIFVAAILTVFYPAVSALVAGGDIKKANYITDRLTVLIVCFSLPIVALFVFRSNDIAALIYGDSLSEYIGPVLNGYAFMIVFSSVYLLLLKVLFSLGKTNLLTLIGVFFLFFNYILNLMLINFWGLQGIAISSALCSFFQCIFLIYILKKEGFILFKSCGLKVIMYHSLILLSSFVTFSIFLDDLLLFIFGFLSFYFALSLTFNKAFYFELYKLK